MRPDITILYPSSQVFFRLDWQTVYRFNFKIVFAQIPPQPAPKLSINAANILSASGTTSDKEPLPYESLRSLRPCHVFMKLTANKPDDFERY